MDEANHLTIVVTVVLLLLALGIVVVGCGLYCRTQVQAAMARLQRKIAELQRKQQGTKPI